MHVAWLLSLRLDYLSFLVYSWWKMSWSCLSAIIKDERAAANIHTTISLDEARFEMFFIFVKNWLHATLETSQKNICHPAVFCNQLVVICCFQQQTKWRGGEAWWSLQWLISPHSTPTNGRTDEWSIESSRVQKSEPDWDWMKNGRMELMKERRLYQVASCDMLQLQLPTSACFFIVQAWDGEEKQDDQTD